MVKQVLPEELINLANAIGLDGDMVDKICQDVGNAAPAIIRLIIGMVQTGFSVVTCMELFEYGGALAITIYSDLFGSKSHTRTMMANPVPIPPPPMPPPSPAPLPPPFRG